MDDDHFFRTEIRPQQLCGGGSFDHQPHRELRKVRESVRQEAASWRRLLDNDCQ
jgi:hypothetical protein